MPPFVGVAVKVTLIPEQIAPEGFAAILTLAGKPGFTIIVIVFEVAGEPVAQVKLLVIMQVIKLPFARVVDVYVEFVAPDIFDPLFCH